MANNRITIKDIAQKAGVSKGTVDRVLHNRGEVSKESRERIEAVLKEMNYEPNVYASALANNKEFLVIVVIPECVKGDYWSKIENGIIKFSQEMIHFNASVRIFHFDQIDPDSCRKVFDELKTETFDGIIFPPVFSNLSHEFAGYLTARNIPYIYIDSYIEDTNPLSYFGMDSYKSGWLAARLITISLKKDHEIAIFRYSEPEEEVINQIYKRCSGFRHFFEKNNLSPVIHDIIITGRDENADREIISSYLKKERNIRYGIMFNSRIHTIAAYLENSEFSNIRLAGFDVIDSNVHYLKNEMVGFLIAQRPFTQGYFALKVMADHLIFRKTAPLRNLIPIDIIIKENVDSYTSFNPLE